MNSPHNASLEELFQQWKTDPQKGLDDDVAGQLLSQYGENKLRAKKKKNLIQRFFDQFHDVMILILLAAAAVSFGVAWYEGNTKEFFEPALIVLIVILNAILGVIQESRAEKALDALQNLSAPHAKVIRNGKMQVINAAAIVPGDIILLEAGDFVPADARLLESSSLKSEESALTGESVASEKDAKEPVAENALLGDRHNMVFSGCSITYGTAKALVTATGMQTEMGKIAGLLEGESEGQTPLQQKLAELGKYLGFVALGACGIIFLIGIVSGIPVMEIFMTAVSLAVSAIPEGLPAIVTVVLSIGVQRMVKRNAIIRRLPAVETLGSASVICSDKTGTLTQNRMTLVKAFDAQTGTTEEISQNNTAPFRQLLQYAVLCCNGDVVVDQGQERHIGDPTETSIVLAAYRNGLSKEKLNELYPRKAELPFDSDRKLMTTINQIDGKNIVIVKGAFDVLAEKCIHGDVEKGRQMTEEMSKEALRIIAVAIKEIDRIPDSPTPEQLESDLTFLGLVGMIDPPRPEAKEAVKLCRSAGIKPVMITGDHIATASAIAKELGILVYGDEAVTGSELASMSERDLDKRVRSISVYARVSPEDKIRIVKAWQKQGEIVAMTGDGVNDAPALKAADIGCAMGITGTDVAKGASDMTLTDDNFATIVEAVKEGRGIYDNIKKAVGFLLGTNIGEVLAVFTAMLMWQTSPLLSMQLLWINLVTDSLPAIALGMEPVEKDVMKRKPKPKNESIFANGLGIRVLLQGAMFAALCLIGFYQGWYATDMVEGGRTMAFSVLAMSQVLHAFNMRSEHSIFRIGWFTNRYLTGAALLSALLVLMVIFVPPIASVFGLIPLPAHLYWTALGYAVIPIVVLELSKAFGFVKPRA